MNATIKLITDSLDAQHASVKGRKAFTKEEQQLPKTLSTAIKSGDWDAHKHQLDAWISSMELGSGGNADCLRRYRAYRKALGV